MTAGPVITFIGAGSTVFTKNLAGDILQRPAMANAQIRLMDINPQRLEESALVVSKIIATLGVAATLTTHTDRKSALDGAQFVITSFQVGGYKPCTVTDFDIPKRFGLRQTIADTLGIGGIMRGLRTVPHLWAIAEDMRQLCPDAILLQYVNPMAINTWALGAKYPDIQQVGLCHSVQHTAHDLAYDLGLPEDEVRYRVAGINHMAFFLEFTHQGRDLYPDLRAGYRAGRIPKENRDLARCPNHIRYEMMTRLGYFVTESSEHFAEYVPWFIKRDRPDLIDRWGIPLDEYPQRCVEQVDAWEAEAARLRAAERIEVAPSVEYASDIIEATLTDTPAVIYGNFPNRGNIPQLPQGCAIEVPTLVDANGLQPTVVEDIPPQLIALIRTNLNVQELTVAALMEENVEHIYHAAMLDPHTAAELDLDQIWDMTGALLAEHGDWLPEFAQPQTRKAG